MAANIRQHIADLMKQNWKEVDEEEHKELFVPIRSLSSVLSDAYVRDALRQRLLEPYQQAEALEVVQNGGMRLFAILCFMNRPELILEFIKQDGYLSTNLDSRLPYEEEDLKRIIPTHYRDFYDKQWVFSAPVFAPNLLHRQLHDKTHLPFLQVTDIGEGGFGKIQRVVLDGAHQGFSESTAENVVVVVKTLKPSQTLEQDSKQEEHILSLLRHLRHPNIIEFYTGFTHLNISHLLLQPADYDLDEFFSREKPSRFDDEAIFNGLYGIASAIDCVHNYFLEDFELELIGCHYDLKPKNILIRGNDFLLSDFGLSRLKPGDQGSASDFKGGVGDYLAPECQNLATNLAKNRIRRPSDIWSFGCILAEMATFIELGAQGVASFADRRKVEFLGGAITLHTFHEGDRPSPKVSEWIGELERKADGCVYRQDHLCLIRRMIEFDPFKRPTSGETSANLFLVANEVVYASISKLFEKVITREDLRTRVEYQRFRLWAQVVGICKRPQAGLPMSAWAFEPGAKLHFDNISTILQALRKDLSIEEELLGSNKDGLNTIVYQRALRTRIDMLWGTVSPGAVRTMEEKLDEISWTQDDPSMDSLVSLGNIGSTHSYRRDQLITAMRQVMDILLRDQESRKEFLVDREIYQVKDQIRDKQLGRVNQPGCSVVHVITELLTYGDSWIGRSEELMGRLDGLVSTLRTISSSGLLPVLHCEGFCHTPERQGFELLFRIPDQPPGIATESRPITLLEMIRSTTSRSKRPPLDQIFVLASKLTDALSTFHQAGWFHKNISSFEILFFPTNPKDPGASLTTPYLTGFNYSRESSENAFTVEPNPDREARDYQHPEYSDAENTLRFREEFDYYSLGLVLLELGRWKSIKHMIKGKETHTPSSIRDFLRQEEVTQLPSYVGQAYTDAVAACLDGSLHVPKRPDDTRANFERDVVSRMSICREIHTE